MTKTSTIIDLTIGLSDSDKALVGVTGQIQLTKHETSQLDVFEFFDTAKDALAEKTSWDT